MTDNQVRAGIDSYILYGVETTFGTEASAFDSVFGIVQSFNASPKRNLIKVRGVNGVLPAANTTSTSRDAIRQLRGRFEASVSVSMQPLDFRFMKYVFGTESGAGTAASVYNYPQATASTDADKKSYLKLPSISLSTNYYFDGTGDNADKAWHFLGGKVNSCTLKGSVGEVVSVDLDIPCADMNGDATLDTPVAMGTQDPYHFIGASFEIPTGSAVGNIVESFELSITNNIEMLYGMGSDVAQEAKPKERDFSLKLTMTQEGTEFMDEFMGGATTLGAPTEIASIKISLSGGTANNNTVIYCLRNKIDDQPQDNTYPNINKETPTFFPEVVYITEQNAA